MNEDSENIIALYRKHAQAWADVRRPAKPPVKWLDKFLGVAGAQASVLDLGCGSGLPVSRYLIDAGCAVTGVDASPELIDFARASVPEATLHIADMRGLNLRRRFDGILAWNSTFHLTPDDQRAMFPVFARHVTPGAALMFTSGTSLGVAMGEYQGDPLYHASLEPEEFTDLLARNGFVVIEHVIEDPECGGQTIWLATQER